MEEFQKPLSYEDWKQSFNTTFHDTQSDAFKRLHDIDIKQDYEDFLKAEYQEYLDDLNGNWLNK